MRNAPSALCQFATFGFVLLASLTPTAWAQPQVIQIPNDVGVFAMAGDGRSVVGSFVPDEKSPGQAVVWTPNGGIEAIP
jgi:hypothetical protein